MIVAVLMMIGESGGDNDGVSGGQCSGGDVKCGK